MKTTIVGLLLLCASAAFGQVGLASIAPVQPIIPQFQWHEMHAEQHAMRSENSLLPSDTYTYARGERPLWECGSLPDPVPLGDVARAYRKEHEYAKKAEFVFEKQR